MGRYSSDSPGAVLKLLKNTFAAFPDRHLWSRSYNDFSHELGLHSGRQGSTIPIREQRENLLGHSE